MRNRLHVVMGVVLLVGVISCDGGRNRAYDDFFARPDSEQMRVLDTLPSDRRLELFVYGMRMFEPPRVYMARVLASRDGQIVGDIVQRLEEGPADWEREVLLYLLAFIACEGEVEVGERVIRVAEESFAGIEDERLRREATKSIRSLRGKCFPGEKEE